MKVLITGTAKGIGKEITKLFLNKGHKVIGIDKLPRSLKHKNYQHIKLDLLNKHLYPEIKGVSILINNAGVQEGKDDINENLKTAIWVTEKYGIQKDIKSILFIASASAINGAEFPYYCASKGGIVSYMKNVANRIAKYKATSNALSPGGVTTELNKHIIEDKKLWDEVMNETLLNKWASPYEIALWSYFVTIINTSATGQNILIDNGEQARFNFIW